MAKDPSTLLIDLYKKDKLGPLYIIRPPVLMQQVDSASSTSKKEQANLTSTWAHNLSIEILKLEKGISDPEAKELEELGASDLYHIKKDSDHKEYKVEEQSTNDFIKAHSYPPLEFKYKIIAVHEADKITERIANKWLKTLEEPLTNVVTLFLTNSNKALLQTIESRAITLRLLPETSDKKLEILPEDKESFSEFLNRNLQGETPLNRIVTDTQKKNLSKFIQSPNRTHFFLDSLKGSRHLQHELYKICQTYAQTRSKGPRDLAHWLEESAWFDKASTYNNAPSERFLGLLQLVQQIED
jgi:hypothetical protein